MTDTMKERLDAEMTAVHWSAQDRTRVKERLEAHPAAPKRFSAGMILVAALLLLSVGALAVGLNHSTLFGRVRDARTALTEQYGLTSEMIRAFNETTTEEGGVTTTVFTPMGGKLLDADKAGVYTAVTDAAGRTTVTWSHDGDDAAWKDGDLTCAVWGAPQLQQAFDRYHTFTAWADENFERFYTLPYAEQQAVYDELAAMMAPLPVPMLGIPEETVEEVETDTTAALPAEAPAQPPERIVAAAQAVLSERFGVSAESLAQFYGLNAIADKGGWTLIYYASVSQDADWRWEQLLYPALGSYVVTVTERTNVDSPDTITGAAWSLADKAQGDFTQSTWGRAEAYTGEMLPWVSALPAQNAPIIALHPDDQTDWFTVAEANAYDQTFRNAGFVERTAYRWNHGLPQPGELTDAEALTLAKEALRAEYALTDADLEAFVFSAEYLLGEHNTWMIGVYGGYSMGYVELDPNGGTILDLKLDSGLGGNG